MRQGSTNCRQGSEESETDGGGEFGGQERWGYVMEEKG